jgi:hypothetical protein
MRLEVERISGGGDGRCLVPLRHKNCSERRARAFRERYARTLARSLAGLIWAIIRLPMLATRVGRMLYICYENLPLKS